VTTVEAADWRDWVATDSFLDPLRERLQRLGIEAAAIEDLIADALADPGWRSMAQLDAGTRLVQSLLDKDGIRRGDEAERVLRELLRDSSGSAESGYAGTLIPKTFWSAVADEESSSGPDEKIKVNGAIVLKVSGLRSEEEKAAEARKPLSLELSAALAEKPVSPLAALWRMLGEDGLLAPLALVLAGAFAVSATMIEALLFRGIFDVSAQLACRPSVCSRRSGCSSSRRSCWPSNMQRPRHSALGPQARSPVCGWPCSPSCRGSTTAISTAARSPTWRTATTISMSCAGSRLWACA
jgi:hypothetical protein